ncbi:trypsin-like peptidase domain-containing protein [Nocardioides sp.]|uniref:S1C family serine protease n=1 Tax=Nocardioides sp. TaxID=35761 RepID=UPI002605359A|nr:trypsin-like peptidase domain-containing protein [Nocardioides sp.]
MSDSEASNPTPENDGTDTAATPVPTAAAQAPTWVPVQFATPAPTPEPTVAHRRRLPAKWRLGVAATAAFLVGCGTAAGVGAAVYGHNDTGSNQASTAQNGYSQTLQTYGNGQSTQGSQSTQGYGGYGSSESGSGSGSSTYGQYPQFGDFSQFGLSDPTQSGGSSAQGATADSTSDATAAQSQGLVEITSTLNGGTAAGTGMILTSSGVIVTNHHVVAGATSVKVTDVSTGKTYEATYVGGDATTDVAVLRLKDASGLTPVSFASSAAATGDTITSVGDAGGDGGSLTASPGTVSALDQNITVSEDDGNTATLSNLIELDAYIVPGDSGGAVFDSSGDVVGMNVAASSGSSTVVGYAIPASTVESIAQDILSGTSSSQISYGYTGYLGVGLSATSSGATVAEVVTGEAAAKAGITAGDTITAFNGTAVTSASQLQELVAGTTPGQKVKVTWQTSSGTSKSATVSLGTGAIA